MTKLIMIDIETTGKPAYLQGKPGCIVAIGAIEFDKNANFGKQFNIRIERQTCYEAGMVDDPETMHWWENDVQAEIMKEMLFPETPVPLKKALEMLNEFVKDSDEVWSNKPQFDMAMLRHAMLLTGTGCSWGFWQERDWYTAYKESGRARDKSEINHDPVIDCIHQVKTLWGATGPGKDNDPAYF